jgi:hypothetical protein
MSASLHNKFYFFPVDKPAVPHGLDTLKNCAAALKQLIILDHLGPFQCFYLLQRIPEHVPENLLGMLT